MKQITLATSIAPFNLELQRRAVASWQRLGFNVISVNSLPELDKVKDGFPGVTFVSVRRDSTDITGKRTVYFDDVLGALVASRSEVCGIINSDIVLSAGNALVDFLHDQAVRCFVFGSRIDVASLDQLDGEEYLEGFDYFFFDKSLISIYPSSDFCLGVPWWDYWAPLVPVIKGIKTKQIISPIAYHLLHETKWDDTMFFAFGKRLRDKLLSLSDLNVPGLEKVIKERYDGESFDFISFSMRIRNLAKGRSEEILTNEVLYDQYKATACIGQYRGLRQRIIAHESWMEEYLWQIRSLNNQLSAAVERNDQVIKCFESSLSWRLTAPLRWLGRKIFKS